MDRRFFILAAVALVGCATGAAPPRVVIAPPSATLGELEPVYSAIAGRDGLTIAVGSNGCTTRADFAFYLERKGEAVTLAFGRKRLDTCKSFAVGRIDLAFTWAELGVPPRTPVFLLNPLLPWTGP
jgi:hypothetical protein